MPYIGSRIKADKATIVKFLEGNWCSEHLFTLQDSYEMYTIYRSHIEGCDQAIETHLKEFRTQDSMDLPGAATEKEAPKRIKKGKDKNHPRFNVRDYLERIHRVDVLNIYGLSETGGLELLAETGTDLSKWTSENHFVSWLNLCTNNKISGGKLTSSALLKRNPIPPAWPSGRQPTVCKKATTGWETFLGARKLKEVINMQSLPLPIRLQKFIPKWFGSNKRSIPQTSKLTNRSTNRPELPF